jgi:transcriptional regulator with XRE-family HTH domain
MIRGLTQHQINEIKGIRDDQIAEIENNKIEIILNLITLVPTKKTLITKIKIKEDLNQNHKLKRKSLAKNINKMLIRFIVNQ